MGRFLINVTLSNKDEVQCRVEARNQKEAIDKLMNVQEFINFVGDKEIKKYEISIDSEKTEKTDDRFLLQKCKKENFYILTDKENEIVCEFEKGRYNETQKFTMLNDVSIEPLELATIMREFGEFLSKNHKDLI